MTEKIPMQVKAGRHGRYRKAIAERRNAVAREKKERMEAQLEKDLTKLDTISAILSLLNQLNEGAGEFLELRRNGRVAISTFQKKGKAVQKGKTVFNVFEALNSIKYLKSVSLVTPPSNPIRNWSGFGEERDKVKKKKARIEKDKEMAYDLAIGLVQEALQGSKHPKMVRHSGPNHHYRIDRADNGAELWFQIDKSNLEEMKLTTGQVAFIRLSEDAELKRIHIQPGDFIRKVRY